MHSGPDWYNSVVNDRALQWIDAAVIVSSIATIPLVVLDARDVATPITSAANWIIWLVFLVDLVADFRRSVGVGRKLFSFAIVVLSFPALPDILALCRLARLSRIARVLQMVGVGHKVLLAFQRTLGRRGLSYVAAIATLSVLIGGGLVFLAEPERVGGFWNGVWWAVVTTTTVGYGDISPVSLGGRLVAVILMLVGIGLFATLGASVAAFFVKSDSDDRLERIEERLSRIEELLKR